MNGYWKCEFKDRKGEVQLRTIYAKTTTSAFKHCFQVGIRLHLEPQYETHREATADEVKELKTMIKKRVKENNKKSE